MGVRVIGIIMGERCMVIVVSVALVVEILVQWERDCIVVVCGCGVGIVRKRNFTPILWIKNVPSSTTSSQSVVVSAL